MKNLLFTLSLTLLALAANAQNTNCWVNIIPNLPPNALPTLYAFADSNQNVTFLWSNNSTDARIMPTAAGTYCVTATYPNGCTATDCYVYTGSNTGGCDVEIEATLSNTGDVRLEAITNIAANPQFVWSTGATTPVIIVNTSGTYCVTVTGGGCVATDCHLYQKNNYLNVYVQTQDSLQGVVAEVYLIEYDSAQGGTLTAVRTVQTMPHGFVQIEDIPAGKYLVKAALLPNSPGYADHLPTYYTNSLLWSEAAPVGIAAVGPGANGNNILIHLIQGTNPGGPGFIGGLVSEGANLSGGVDDRGEGDPIEGANVVLQMLDGTPVAADRTDASGVYGFDNLAYGTYKISLDIPGIPVTSAIITLSPDKPAIKELNFKADEDSSVLPAPEAGAKTKLAVWPNPASTSVTVELLPGENLLTLRNALGSVVYQIGTQDEQANIPLGSLPVGVYLLSVRNGERIVSQQVYKQ